MPLTGCATNGISEDFLRNKHPKTEFKDCGFFGKEFKGGVVTTKADLIYNFPSVLEGSGNRIIELKIPIHKGSPSLVEVESQNVFSEEALLIYTTLFSNLKDFDPDLFSQKFNTKGNVNTLILYTYAQSSSFGIYQKPKGKTEWEKLILDIEDVKINWENRNAVKHLGYVGLGIMAEILWNLSFVLL